MDQFQNMHYLRANFSEDSDTMDQENCWARKDSITHFLTTENAEGVKKTVLFPYLLRFLRLPRFI